MTILNNKSVLIVDSDIGNVGSVYRALKNIGCNPIVSNKKKDLLSVTHIILPGVGSFDHGMEKLNKCDLSENIIKATMEKGIPLLGICLGMQLLATIGFENKQTKGLNLIPGSVEKLMIPDDFRVPHLGWNQVSHTSNNKLLKSIPDNKDFYFVHSYVFKSKYKKNVIGKTNYGKDFASIINKANIYGVQFHTEKSLKFGIKLLENFIKI